MMMPHLLIQRTSHFENGNTTDSLFGPCHLFPLNQTAAGEMREKVQIPLCRHSLRKKFGPV